MITVKTKDQIDKMRVANGVVKSALEMLKEKIRAGISTLELNKIAHEYILSQKCTPSFLNYRGYPCSICASVNDVVVHGIPRADIVLKEGDIISIDIGAIYQGYHGDSARTFKVGQIDQSKEYLIDVTRQCFYEGIKGLKDGSRVGDIGYRIESYASGKKCGVVRALVGHGIGSKMHEPPDVPNFGKNNSGVRLSAGMTLAIEPMINLGSGDVTTDGDGWTVRTADGSSSAHYENTVVILTDGIEILS